MSPNLAASIRARLLNEARRRDEPFEPFLVRYACERFLYRLGSSALRERCILKGAGLLSLWMPDPYRATRDVDLLATGGSDEATVRANMEAICRVPCPEDGLVLDLDSLSVAPIRGEQKYPGQRAIMRARLGKTRIRLQVDFGFGDALSVPPEEVEIPPLVDHLPAPRVRSYPRVATVAEKLEAMVQLGRRNSRMKDFHDIWALSQRFRFDGPQLRDAIAACFARRETPWSSAVPDVLTTSFYADPDVQTRWGAYMRRSQFRAADQFVTDAALHECHLPYVAAGSVLVAITGEGQTRGRVALLAFDSTFRIHHSACVIPHAGRRDVFECPPIKRCRLMLNKRRPYEAPLNKENRR